MDKIEHVVVLMLENRSFDSMLGWLYEHDSPTLNIPPAQTNDSYRGLQSVDLSKFENTALNGSLAVRPTRGAQGFTVPTVDPGEEFEHVNQQFFNTTSPKAGQPATMTGVLSDFVGVLQERKYTGDDLGRRAKEIMQTYTPAQLSVLSQLARHYAVCDDWFASVPSQTNPNRAFLLCATSKGMVNNGFLETDSRAAPIEEALGMKIGDDRVDATTIFNQLAVDGKDWAVFWQTSYLPKKMSTLLDILDNLIVFLNVIPSPVTWAARIAADALLILATLKGLGPAALQYLRDLSAGDLASSYTWRLFPQISQRIPNADKKFQRLDDFHARARNGTLPAFSYIEPYWSISRATTGNSIGERLISGLGNDYHPPSNVLVGEEFVKAVYTSLISNTDAWHKTLLVISFDESVGTFDHVTDHVAAGTVTPPWGSSGQAPKCEKGFKFDRLGGRVPTILVSPYIQKGTVFRSTTPVPYDHTSVIATIMKWIGKQTETRNFGSRATNAPTFENVLTLAAPRTDETALPFLDTVRIAGDPLRYGDSFWLKNQNGDYLTAAYPTMKVAFGGAVVPQEGIDLLADIGLAAYFPRYGSGETVAVTLVSHSPDPGPQVRHGDIVRLVSREPQLGSRNVLGAWPDSSDCYYYDEYVDGDNAGKQAWTVQKVHASNTGVCYGDSVYLVSASTAYAGQRLTRDAGWIRTDNWITTSKSGGDSWTIVPAPARVGQGSRFWEQAPLVGKVCASAQGGSRGLQLWATDSNSHLCSTFQDKPNGTWSSWMTGWDKGGPSRSVGFVTAALQNHSEVVQIWALGYGSAPEQLWSRWQTSPGGAWTNWSVWKGAPVAGPIAACREGGPRCVRLWSVDANDKLRCNYLDKPNGRWVGWSPPGWNGAPDNLREVCAVLQGDGTIRVWITDVAPNISNVYTAVQKSPGGDDWTGWALIGTFYRYASLAACQTGDGGAQLCVIDGPGVLHTTSQPTPGAVWTPWDPPADQHKVPGWQGASWVQHVTAAAQPGGEAGIWAVETSGKLHYKAQTGGVWGEWTPPF